jgi:hypothetical protein
VVFICGEIKDLVSDSDKHYAYLEDPDDLDLNNEFSGLNEDEVDDLKREYVLLSIWYSCLADKWLLSWARSYTAVRELNHLIPNFQKKIDEGSPEELTRFYTEASKLS